MKITEIFIFCYVDFYQDTMIQFISAMFNLPFLPIKPGKSVFC